MTPEQNLRLLHRILTVIEYDNRQLDLIPEEDGTIRAEVGVPEMFDTHGSEEITPDNIEVFEQAVREVHALIPAGTFHGMTRSYDSATLFSCRVRRCRPRHRMGKLPVDPRVMHLIEAISGP